MVTNPNAPPGTTAVFQITSPFTDTLTTNQSVYSAGEPVQMTFTMTNTSDEPASVVWGAVNDGFIVKQGSQVVWQSNSGVNPQFLVNDTVQPGKSLTFPGTWDGTVASDSTTTTLTGSFVVTNQLAPSVSANFQIATPLSESLNVSQLVSGSANAPLNFVYTITNNSNVGVQFNLAPIDFVVTTPIGTTAGATVWESDSNASSQPSTTETLQAGQSMTETATWNGVANEGTLTGANVWGAFNVAATGATTAITQGFQIANPLNVSVATNQSTYQPGQSVQITATETNSSNQAITILNTQNAFTVVSGSHVTFPVTDVSSSAPFVTLQPGQSETLTATWDPSAVQGGTGSTTGTNASESYSIDFKNYMGVTSSSPFVIESPPTAPTSPPTNPTSPPTTPTSPPTAPSSPPLEPIAPVVNPNSPSGESSSTPTSATSNSGPISVILTTNQSGSRSGHPVRLTVKLKNVTKTSQRLAANAKTDGITVLEGSTVVSKMTRSLLTSKAKTLKAGQSIQLTSTWNGKPNQAGMTKLNPGLYTVMVNEGGYSASTTIRIN